MTHLSAIKDAPQKGRFDDFLLRQIPTIQGNSPFLARLPPTILSHSNFEINSSSTDPFDSSIRSCCSHISRTHESDSLLSSALSANDLWPLKIKTTISWKQTTNFMG